MDSVCNKTGKGIIHNYDQQNIAGDKIVTDKATDLMWQQGGSSHYMKYLKVKNWIAQLNITDYAGYNNWRLPTLEEAMSLVEREKKNGDLYINPVFDKTQMYIWTSDLAIGASSYSWIVSFDNGSCYSYYVGNLSYYVPAVRSRQSSE